MAMLTYQTYRRVTNVHLLISNERTVYPGQKIDMQSLLQNGADEIEVKAATALSRRAYLRSLRAAKPAIKRICIQTQEQAVTIVHCMKHFSARTCISSPYSSQPSQTPKSLNNTRHISTHSLYTVYRRYISRINHTIRMSSRCVTTLFRRDVLHVFRNTKPPQVSSRKTKARHMHGHDFFLSKQPLKDTLTQSAPLFLACGVLLAIEAALPSAAPPKTTSVEDLPGMLEELAQDVKKRKPIKDSSNAEKGASDWKIYQKLVNDDTLASSKSLSADPITVAVPTESLKNVHYESADPVAYFGCDTCYAEGYNKGYAYGHGSASHRGWAYYSHEVEKKSWSKDFATGFSEGCSKGYKDGWFSATTNS